MTEMMTNHNFGRQTDILAKSHCWYEGQMMAKTNYWNDSHEPIWRFGRLSIRQPLIRLGGLLTDVMASHNFESLTDMIAKSNYIITDMVARHDSEEWLLI